VHWQGALKYHIQHRPIRKKFSYSSFFTFPSLLFGWPKHTPFNKQIVYNEDRFSPYTPYLCAFTSGYRSSSIIQRTFCHLCSRGVISIRHHVSWKFIYFDFIKTQRLIDIMSLATIPKIVMVAVCLKQTSARILAVLSKMESSMFAPMLKNAISWTRFSPVLLALAAV
jgi:hypothetical protein